MKKMINKYTGTEMYVADDRVQEYTDAGHRLADAPAPVPPKAPKKPTRSRKK